MLVRKLEPMKRLTVVGKEEKAEDEEEIGKMEGG
jgi:hypothetical protein